MVKSEQELAVPAAEIARLAQLYPIICFNGSMGAGKTTMIKQVCAHLQVTDAVSSPTYSVVNEYHTAAGKSVYHFDFYRLDDPAEAIDIGTLEYFDSGSTWLLEWPEKIEGLLPKPILLVNIDIVDTDRVITLTTPTNED